MKAVIYARYSSDQQRDASIEDQVRLCRERLVREGWTLTQTYADRAISGGSLLRPGIQALIEDAMAARFTVVVAEALDRISRDQADVAAFYKRMQFAGIRIITLAEGEITDLHVGLKGTMNALFLKDLADKTRRGLRGRVEAGASAGGRCYGYDVVHAFGPDGLPVHGQRRINEAEAAVVRRVFRDYATGLSPKRIALALNAEGIPAPSGGTWGPSTINGNAERGTGVLNNELYIGRLVWNRLRYIKDPDSGKRVSRLNAPDQWVVQEVPELRIVGQELWNRVKARQAQMTNDVRGAAGGPQEFWDRRRPRFLLSGLIRCGCCGGGYSKISANLFGCSAARNKGPTACGNRMNIRRDVLEATVLDSLRRRLMEPKLFKVFCEEFTAELNRQLAAESSTVDQAKAELARVERRMGKLVDAIAEGVPARSVKDELVRLEARQEELRLTLAEAPAKRRPLLHPNMADLYRARVTALQDALTTPDTQAEAAELIRSLIEAVVLMPEDGTLRVDLHGALAGILALCSGTRKAGPVSGAGLAEQIKMVAGAGFEPATFRL
ncbi:recombinase family protein [Azospirillum argentinense]